MQQIIAIGYCTNTHSCQARETRELRCVVMKPSCFHSMFQHSVDSIHVLCGHWELTLADYDIPFLYE